MKKLSPTERRVLGLSLVGCFGALSTGALLANGMFGSMTVAIAIFILVIALCREFPKIRRALLYQLAIVGVGGAITFGTRQWFGLNGLVDFGMMVLIVGTTIFLWRATAVALRGAPNVGPLHSE